MKAKKSVLVTLAVLGMQAPAFAADLLDTYHAAQGQDSVFAAAKSARDAGSERLTQGRSTLLPSVNLTATSTYNNNEINYTNAPTTALISGPSKFINNTAAITLVQPLYRQNNWKIYSQSELQAEQADLQYKSAEQDLIVRAAQAYFDVLAAQDAVNLADAQKVAIGEQLAQAKRNFEVGSATITDTLEAQARYDLTNTQAISAQSNLEIKQRSYQQLTKDLPRNLKTVGDSMKMELPQPADEDKWVEQAMDGNLQLGSAKAAAEIAEKEVEKARGGHYPTLDLIASYSKTKINPVGDGTFNNGNNAVENDQTNSYVGVQLNVPLFQGGSTNSKWREAADNRDRANSELESARRNVDLQTRQAYTGVVNGMTQVQALEQALKSSEKLLEASKLGHEVGVRTNLDVLNAQQQLYATRRDLAQAKYNYLVSRLKLKQAIGALSEDELKVVNQALQ